MTAKNDLQQAIIELRRRLGLTQQDLAIHLGKAVVTVARWETARPPQGESLAALVRMAQAAGHADLADVFARWLGLSSPPPARPGAEGKAEIAAAVRRLRLNLGLTQEQLGQKLGVAGRVVRTWEAGVHRPGPKFTLRMSAMAGAETGGLADIFAAEAAEALGLSEERLNVQTLNPVRQLREHAGYTQQDLAVRAGLSVRGIASYESGEREPTGKALAQLAKVAAEMGHADLAKLFARKLMEQLGLSHGDWQILADAAEADNEPK